MARPDSTYPIIINPYKLDISQFGEKVRDQIKFTISNLSDKELAIKIILSPTDLADLKLPTKVAAHGTVEGLLKLKKTALDQRFERCITLELNDDVKTRFTIPIKREKRTQPIIQPATQTGTGH